MNSWPRHTTGGNPSSLPLITTSQAEQGWRKAWDTTADCTGIQVSLDCPEHKDWNDDLVQLASSKVRHAASLKL
jgi:hypothetical protein